LLLWSHLFQFLKAPAVESTSLVMNIAKKRPTATQPGALTEEQQDSLKKDARQVLIDGNLIERLEKLPQIRESTVIILLAKKLRELLKSR